MPDTRPDMRQRALFVTSIAACRWNKMLLAELKVDIPRAAVVVATEHRARGASGCHPPSVAIGTGNSCTLLPASWTTWNFSSPGCLQDIRGIYAICDALPNADVIISLVVAGLDVWNAKYKLESTFLYETVHLQVTVPWIETFFTTIDRRRQAGDGEEVQEIYEMFYGPARSYRRGLGMSNAINKHKT